MTFESEKQLEFGSVDLYFEFEDERVIVEIDGRIHEMKDKIDAKSIYKVQAARRWGYTLITIRDKDYVKSINKKEFI